MADQLRRAMAEAKCSCDAPKPRRHLVGALSLNICDRCGLFVGERTASPTAQLRQELQDLRLLAEALHQEARRRGASVRHPAPRRFPQPEMAALLGYSLRQYQRLEDADDGSLPSWDDLTEILTKLDRPPSDIFGDEEPDPNEELQPAAANPGRSLAAEVAEIRVLLEALATAQCITFPSLPPLVDEDRGEPWPSCAP